MNTQVQDWVRNKMELSIEEVVDQMPEWKLDWALTQVDNSLRKYKGTRTV